MPRLIRIFILSLLFASSTSFAKDWVYVVTEGDNLWNIAKAHLNKVSYYEDIKRLNNITHPRRMKPGTVIRVPLEWVKNHSASVKIKALTGEHQVLRDGKLADVTTDTLFTLGDELRVGSSGNLTLVFADGSEMTLSQGVIVNFDHLSYYGQTGMVDTRVRLTKGKMEIRAEKQKGSGSRLDIATASAITSVRGTIFRVGVAPGKESASMVEVIEGEVAVGKGDKSVAVKQGFGIKVEKDKELPEPVKLLDAPKLLKFPGIISKQNYELHWQAVVDSSYYQAQLAKDRNFSDIVWQRKLQSTTAPLPDIKDGIYYFRVTAADLNGIEGVPSEVMLQLNAFPLAPEVTPIAVIHSNGTQTLNWQYQQDNASQKALLQISNKPDFTDIQISKHIDGNSFRPDKSLPINDYYWRVAELENSTSVNHGPFSKPSKFRFTLLLPAPKLKGVTKDNYAQVVWKPLPDNQYIEIEIDETLEFNNPEKFTVTEEARKIIPESESKVRYLRARSRIVDEKQPGKWSKYCKILSSTNMILCGK